MSHDKIYEKGVADFFSVPSNYLHRDFGVKIRAMLVAELLGPMEGQKILDIGCGDGRISLQFQDQNALVLVDQSDAMLHLAKSFVKNGNQAHVSIVNASVDEFMQKGPRPFDAIVCIGLLAHLKNWQQKVQELAALLVPGGRIAIQISDASRWLTRFQLRAQSNRQYKLNRIVMSDLIDACSAAGLERVGTRRFGLLLPGMGRLPNSFLYRYTKGTISNPILRSFTTEAVLLFKKRSS